MIQVTAYFGFERRGSTFNPATQVVKMVVMRRNKEKYRRMLVRAGGLEE